MNEKQAEFIKKIGLSDFKFDMTGVGSMLELALLKDAKRRLKTAVYGFTIEAEDDTETCINLCSAVEDRRTPSERSIHLCILKGMQKLGSFAVISRAVDRTARYAGVVPYTTVDEMRDFDNLIQAFRHHLLDQMIADVIENMKEKDDNLHLGRDTALDKET